MLALTSTLLAKQKKPTKPIWKVVLTPETGDAVTYDKTRIKYVKRNMGAYNQTIVCLLHNRDQAITDLDFKGYTGVFSRGLVTGAGEEYAATPPMRVVAQKFISQRTSTGYVTDCELTLWGTPEFLARDFAEVYYLPEATDVKTVKDIITMLFDGSAPYANSKVYTVDFDSEDTLLDTLVLADSYKIYKGESRLLALRRALDKTGSAVKFDNDGHITIFAPYTSVPSDETLRPNADGDESNTSRYPASGGWYDKIDEVVADEWTTFFWSANSSTYLRTLVNISNPTAVSASIGSITVYARCMAGNAGDEGPPHYPVNQECMKIAIKTGGTVYEGDGVELATTFTNYSKTWATNPKTTAKWTLADLAALQVGVALRGPNSDHTEDVGACTQVWVVVTYDYDYEYSFETGDHPFFAKTYRTRLIIPNRVVVTTPKDVTPAYSGTAVDDDSYAALGYYLTKPQELNAANDAEALAVANAMLAKLQMFADGGSGSVPLNLGAEVFDYVKITDNREGDYVVGTVGTITEVIDTRKSPMVWNMGISIGSPADATDITIAQIQNPSNVTGQNSYFARLSADDAYIKNLTAESLLIYSHQASGFTFTDNSPTAGYVAWSAGTVTYKGDTWDVVAGNTNKKYIWWDKTSPTAFQTSDTKPTLETDDFLMAINNSGVHRQIWDATMIDGGSIVTNTITANEIKAGTITANEIDMTSVTLDTIGEGTTYGRVLTNQLDASKILLSSTYYQVDENGVITGTLYGTSTRLTADGLVGAVLKGAITAFADGGGGKTQITTTGHGLWAGAKVLIVGTTNYNGVYAVTDWVDANNYKITKAYVAEAPGANAKTLQVSFLSSATDGSSYIAAGSMILDSTGIDFLNGLPAKFYYGTSNVGNLKATSATKLQLTTYDSGIDLDLYAHRDLYGYGLGVCLTAGMVTINPDNNDFHIKAYQDLMLYGGRNVVIQTNSSGSLSFFNVTPRGQQGYIAPASDLADVIAKFNVLIGYLEADAGFGLIAGAP